MRRSRPGPTRSSGTARAVSSTCWRVTRCSLACRCTPRCSRSSSRCSTSSACSRRSPRSRCSPARRRSRCTPTTVRSRCRGHTRPSCASRCGRSPTSTTPTARRDWCRDRTSATVARRRVSARSTSRPRCPPGACCSTTDRCGTAAARTRATTAGSGSWSTTARGSSVRRRTSCWRCRATSRPRSRGGCRRCWATACTAASWATSTSRTPVCASTPTSPPPWSGSGCDEFVPVASATVPTDLTRAAHSSIVPIHDDERNRPVSAMASSPRCSIRARGLFTAVMVLSAACLSGTSPTSAGAAEQNDGPAKSPPLQARPAVTTSKLDAALAQLPAVVRAAMRTTGDPGVAVGVVWRDKAVFVEGFGVREEGEAAEVTPDTVFQLASTSKPIASTVVAAAVGEKKLAWDDPVVEYLPTFALADPYVTQHVTVADLFAHRSGLPDHAGDYLQYIGYDREYILSHLHREPLAAFRANYAYTNLGLTAAALASAAAAGTDWEDLSAQLLYRPLGMTSTSSRFADYLSAGNRALTHVKVGDEWVAKYTFDDDVASPAGGVSTSARDMTKWMRLQLANGKFEGNQVVDADALARTHLPATV